MGVPCKQLHSYDYGGPYAVFTGAANFYKEIDRMVNTQVWKMIMPPWEKNPELGARPVVATKVKKARENGEKVPARSVRPVNAEPATIE
jgi:nitrogenase molybdenum-iron protein alpha chain